MKTDLGKKVLDAVRSHSLVSSGARVVVAVSGGADSMALLNVLHALSPELSLHLVVAHFNHLLRGSASDGDEAFVRNAAEDRGLCFYSGRMDARISAAAYRTSVEEAARNDRYAFFRKIAGETGAEAIAVAHHADDQAETFLLRLLRGAGTDGLSAMAWRSPGGIIRPFLGVCRRDVCRYVHEQSIAYRDDATNAEMYYLRNRVRHELLPLLKTYNPAIVSALCSSADILTADSAVIDACLAPLREKLMVRSGHDVEMDVTRIARELPGVRLRLYRAALAEAAGNLRRIAHVHLKDIDRIVMSGGTGKSLDLPGGLTVRLSYDILTVAVARETEVDSEPVQVLQPGVFTFGTFIVDIKIAARNGMPEGTGREVFLFDACLLRLPLLIRGLQAGDRFQPFGLNGHIKLKDFFINNRIDRSARKTLPLVVDATGTIILVGDLRRSGVAPVTAATTSILAVTIARRQP